MAAYLVHFSVGEEYDETFTVEGEVEECRAQVAEFFAARNLDPEKVNAWSEEIA